MFGLRFGSAVQMPLKGMLASAMLAPIAATVLSYQLWPHIEAITERIGSAREIADDLLRAAVVAMLTFLCVATIADGQTDPSIFFPLRA